jgi:hypothetical protein
VAAVTAVTVTVTTRAGMARAPHQVEPRRATPLKAGTEGVAGGGGGRCAGLWVRFGGRDWGGNTYTYNKNRGIDIYQRGM